MWDRKESLYPVWSLDVQDKLLGGSWLLGKVPPPPTQCVVKSYKTILLVSEFQAGPSYKLPDGIWNHVLSLFLPLVHPAEHPFLYFSSTHWLPRDKFCALHSPFKKKKICSQHGRGLLHCKHSGQICQEIGWFAKPLCTWKTTIKGCMCEHNYS